MSTARMSSGANRCRAARNWASSTAAPHGVTQCVDGGNLAVQPAGHRPRPRIAEVGVTHLHRYRDGQGNVRGEPGQPLEFLPGLPNCTGMAGQPDGQFLAQSVNHVVRAYRGEQLQGQPGPLRELRIDQAPDQCLIDPGAGVCGTPGYQEQLPWSTRSMRRAVATITVVGGRACRPILRRLAAPAVPAALSTTDEMSGGEQWLGDHESERFASGSIVSRCPPEPSGLACAG